MFDSYNYSLAERHNFLNQITSVKERLHTWGHRGLTLAGRILIFKSMAPSKTVYTSIMVSPPKQFIDLLSSIKQNFIWNGRCPKIKHSALVGGYAEGGYKDVDIQSQLESLKIIWIRRLLDDNFHIMLGSQSQMCSFWIWELMQFFMTILNLPHIECKKINLILFSINN